MRIQQRSDTQIHVALNGPIGETSPLFTLPVGEAKELLVDMSAVTYINSVGVKHWIIWNSKIPPHCEVKLTNCPFVIASQASMVMGFMAPNMKIESVRAPYLCNACGAEEMRLVSRGIDYEYASPGKPAHLPLPSAVACGKCSKGDLEPDFMAEKTFKFLG